jgi:hypothetical protein
LYPTASLPSASHLVVGRPHHLHKDLRVARLKVLIGPKMQFDCLNGTGIVPVDGGIPARAARSVERKAGPGSEAKKVISLRQVMS